ncbi:DUF3857 domain-containing protein [Neolewinella aurantiaca]|uniref:DUF3857 domain-containing protein n=1 Tax=Neolewinella aurantiaca TaxID=2602767 RepID=UPI001650B366|nr:DUF3857 domain-containing protein [Neolewinella aurantiaca]
MKNSPFTTLFVCLLLFTGTLFAQKDEVKFGKIPDADREMMSHPTDSTAEAFVLHDLLSLEFVQNTDGAPMTKEYRHRRLKLFTAASFDRADIEIIYHRESDRVNTLKGVVHFPDGSSKKLSRSDFIRERYDEDYDICKFTFPGVREGAIIEYSYVKTDEYIVIPSRYFFQEDIPVRWAEYRAVIPPYFKYVSLSTAAKNYTINSVKTVNGNYGSQNLKHTGIRWVMKDLPAYSIQPYINNFSDYLPQVKLQLQTVHYPGQAPHNIFSDWQKTTEEIDDWIDFGKAYRNDINSNKVWKEVEPLLAGATTDQEKAKVLYDFVAGKISWDGNYRWTADLTPNKVFSNARGSSGEMSILLLALLRQANIEAKPLIVPLRNGGAPLEIYPLLNQFDHLMVLATLDGKDVLLDPNTILRPMGLPRIPALNHRAFVADPENPHWIDVSAPRAVKITQVNMSLDAEGMADVGLEANLKSYYGVTAREKLEEMENDNEFPILDEVIEAYPETELVNKEVDKGEDNSGPLNLKLNLKVPIAQAVDDYLYLQPVLFPVLDEGLDDVEQRLFPVDFAYPWQERYIASITIPEGYVVDELPASERIVSEDNTFVVTFASEDKGNGVIGVNFNVSVKQTVYPANEYAGLREMFRRVINCQEATIVLKKAE